MNQEKPIEKLREWLFTDDYEMAHIEADAILCELLISLGYKDVVDVWRQIHKWYA